MPFGLIGNIISTGVNAKISKDNLNFQKQAWAEQQKQNALTRQREDNASQRKVADLKAAGINPILASGQQAQAGPVSVGQAPQNNFKMDMDTSNVGAQTMALMKMKKELSIMDAQKKSIEADAVQKQAQTNLLANQANTEGQRIQNLKQDFENLRATNKHITAQTALTYAQKAQSEVNALYQQASTDEKKRLLPLLTESKAIENALQGKDLSNYDTDKWLNRIGGLMDGLNNTARTAISVMPFTNPGSIPGGRFQSWNNKSNPFRRSK